MLECQRTYDIDAKASNEKEKFVKWRFENDNCLGNLMIKMEFK
jgi:hypothetical protein